MTASRSRPGFALLAVLWIMVGVSTVGLALALVARRCATAAHDRGALLVAEWAAEDCVNRSEEIIGDALVRAEHSPADTMTWATLDRYSPNAPDGASFVADSDCAAGLRAAGTTIDVNTADHESLTRVLVAAGKSPRTADSLADAILDWRDPDQDARAHGAEAPWYVAYGRAPPRNAPFANVHELEQVRGLEELGGLDTLFGVDSDRIVFDRAPLAVIASLPGLGDEALARLAEIRFRGARMDGLLPFSALLSPDARDALMAAYPELARRTTTQPDAWILTARGWSGVPRVSVDIQVRLVRAGPRAAVVRRRMWVE